MARLYMILVTLVVCGAVVSPITQGYSEHPVDDFPLSWYPMFARPRPALETPVYVVAVDPDGTRHKVSNRYWTSGGFNQGATQLLQAARAGRSALDPICERVAERVGTSRSPSFRAVESIRLFKGSYSRESWFRDGDHTPVSEKQLATCVVPERVAPERAP